MVINSIEIPAEFVELAKDWHGGQSSMLYAIASTGKLETGKIRPPYAYSDKEWYHGLFIELTEELWNCILHNGEGFYLGSFHKWAAEKADEIEEAFFNEDGTEK
jgi:hypothetical protein